jgi:hypothetical protein
MIKIMQIENLSVAVLTLPRRVLVMIANQVITQDYVHGVAHSVAQVAIHSQVASQGTGVVKVHNEDMVMYSLSTSTSQ